MRCCAATVFGTSKPQSDLSKQAISRGRLSRAPGGHCQTRLLRCPFAENFNKMKRAVRPVMPDTERKEKSQVSTKRTLGVKTASERICSANRPALSIE